RVVAAGQRLAEAPRQLAFVFVQAPVAGIVARPPAPTGTYVSDSTTVAVLGVAAVAEVAGNL
ncbi:MAG: hypothetical protein H7Z21_14220, partial [Hymenobacter sp.]|nr:hypothetical protein [Hymenobacter sp.]